MNFEDRTAFSSEGGKSRSGITAMLWSNRSRWGKFGIILMALIMLSTIASLFARFAIIDKYRAADLKVAVIAPLTGDLSGFGLAMKQGAELFIASNQNDPSGSLIVGVEVLDSEGNPQKAAELTKKIAESGEYASVIGGWSGDVVAAIAKEAAANNLPHLAIAPQSLGSTKSSDGTFFLNYTKRDEVRFLANYVRNVQGEKLVSIIVDDTTHRHQAELFTETFERFGIEIRHIWSLSGNGPSREASRQRIAKEIKETPDSGALFLAINHTDAAMIVANLKQLRAINRLVGSSDLSTNAFTSAFNSNSYDGLVHQILAPSPLISDTGNEQAQGFFNSYITAYGSEPDWVSAYTYEAIGLVLRSARQNTADNIVSYRELVDSALASGNHIEHDDKHSLTETSTFDAARQANPPIKVGSYDGKTLISALTQLLPIADGEVSNFIEAVREGRALYVNDRFMYKTNVVYTGVLVNEITNFDASTGEFEMNFTIWFRYRSDFEPQDIVFANAVEPIKLETPDRVEESPDLIYRRYQVDGKFKANFIDIERNYGSELIGTSFRHRVLNRNNLIYVVDVVGMNLIGGGKFVDQIRKKNVLAPAMGLIADRAWISQEILPVSGLGSPVFVGHGKPSPDYSQTNAGIVVKPGTLSLRDLIPNDFLIYTAIFAALGSIFALLMDQKREGTRLFWNFQSWLLRFICWPMLLVALGSLVLNFAFSHLEFYHVQLLVPIYESLWWVIGAALVILAVERFIWQPLEIRAERKVPGAIRAFSTIVILLFAGFGIIAFVFDQQLTSLLATSGLAAMIIGLAIQANIANIFSGIVLNIEKPLRTGDWIRTDAGRIGEVIDITWRSTKIRSRQDTTISLPNAKVAEATIENFSQPAEQYFVRKVLTFGLHEDPERIREVLINALNNAELADGRSKYSEVSARMIDIDGTGLKFVVRYDCVNREMQSDQDHMALSSIMRALKEAGIEIRYNQFDTVADRDLVGIT